MGNVATFNCYRAGMPIVYGDVVITPRDHQVTMLHREKMWNSSI